MSTPALWGILNLRFSVKIQFFFPPKSPTEILKLMPQSQHAFKLLDFSGGFAAFLELERRVFPSRIQSTQLSNCINHFKIDPFWQLSAPWPGLWMAARLEVTLFWDRPHCFCCANQVVLILTRHLHDSSRGVCIKARSPKNRNHSINKATNKGYNRWQIYKQLRHKHGCRKVTQTSVAEFFYWNTTLSDTLKLIFLLVQELFY